MNSDKLIMHKLLGRHIGGIIEDIPMNKNLRDYRFKRQCYMCKAIFYQKINWDGVLAEYKNL